MRQRFSRRKKEPRRDWKEYNQKQVGRGEILIPANLLPAWVGGLDQLNKDKVGHPFIYPDILLEALGFWKCFCKMDYRTVQGICRQLAMLLNWPASPHFSTISRRLLALGKVHYMKRDKVKAGKTVYAVFDGTGVKVCNRGEWLHRKKKGLRKGFVRVSFVTDAKTGKVLDFSVTSEKVAEKRSIKPMLDRVQKSHKVEKVFGDGLYDTNENFHLLKKRRIKPALKIRRNAVDGPPYPKPEMNARLAEVRKYLRWGYKKWAQKRQYGKRWRVEGSFSRLKGYFGEYAFSKGMDHIKSEMGLKVHYLNQLV